MTPEHCSDCGTKQAADAKFCKKCGKSFEPTQPVAAQTEEKSEKPKTSTAKKTGGGIAGVIVFLVVWAIIRGASQSISQNSFDTATWHTLSINSKASVDMPCTPTPKDEKSSANGLNITTTRYACPYTKAEFDVFYTHYPDDADTSDQHAILDATVTGAGESAKGKVTKKEFKTVYGKNVVDYTIEAPNNETLYARNILSGNDLYILGYEPTSGSDTQYFDKLVNSFKIN